ncbi:ATP-binding Cassette (ABC) Superfamily, partial [Achlya hypogyna]
MAPTLPKAESAPLLAAAKTPLLSAHCPNDVSNAWSAVVFSWLTPLLDLGNARSLQTDDLFQLNPADRATTAAKLFHAQWAHDQATKSSPKLYRAFARIYARPCVVTGILKIVHLSLQFIGPVLIKSIVAYLGTPDKSLSIGLYYTLAVFLSGVLQSLALRQFYFVAYEVGLRLRSAVVMAVYDKALRLSSTQSTGDVATLVSVDAQRLQEIVNNAHSLWYTPLQVVVTSVLMYRELGVAFLGGAAVLVVVVPLTSLMTSHMRSLQGPLMAVKDTRLKAIGEVLTGIKVLKLQAWETSFVARILNDRAEELRQLRRYLLAKGYGYTVFNAVPSLVTVAAFGLYVYLGHSLDLGTALTSIALFENVRYPLINFPASVTALIEAQVSFERLEAFLARPEYAPVTVGDLDAPGIRLRRASFAYDGAADVPVLHNISLDLHCNHLVAVVGRVGAGKSSLVQAVLGNVSCVSGSVHLKGSVAYVSQQPFIQNATLRDNITFGLPFEHAKYQEAVRVASLAADLRILPGGDLTEIGEKGINLSGGQRTRVAIARAVYQDADIYLLDDPLAAVDSHVGADIFKQCIQTALKGKLVVLVTNGLHFLKDCDAVVVLADGRIAEHGSYAELVADAAANPVLAAMLASIQSAPADGTTDVATDALPDAAVAKTRAQSTTAADGATGDLIVAEDRSEGSVPLSTYLHYVAAAGGVPMLALVLLLFASSQAVTLLYSLWLSTWSRDAHSAHQTYYLGIYIALNALATLLYLLRNVAVVAAGLAASHSTFAAVLRRILQAPMSFFDTTPLGRVINRLSKDVYVIDEAIPLSVNNVVGTAMAVVSTVVILLLAMPAFALCLGPLGYVYLVTQRYYLGPSCELQRLDATSRSPVHALLTETLDGLVSIRAYQVQPAFRARQALLLDVNQRAYFLSFSTTCWLGVRLEFIGSLFATLATLLAVLATPTDVPAFAGAAGVALSYCFSIPQTLNWLVRTYTMLQTQMVSVERIDAYTTMATEAEWTAPPA